MNHVFILAVDHGYDGNTPQGVYTTMDLAKAEAMKLRGCFFNDDDTVVIQDVTLDVEISIAKPKIWFAQVTDGFDERKCLGNWIAWGT